MEKGQKINNRYEIVKSIGNCVQIVVLNNKKECDKVKECYKELNFMVIANKFKMKFLIITI